MYKIDRNILPSYVMNIFPKKHATHVLLWDDSAISDHENKDLFAFMIISKTLKGLSDFKTTSTPLLIINTPNAYM